MSEKSAAFYRRYPAVLFGIILCCSVAKGSSLSEWQSSEDLRGPAKCPDKCHPCSVGVGEKCADGVKLISDPCGCCASYCARQEGEECSTQRKCQSGLQCSNGTCRTEHPSACVVGSTTYQHGAVWRPDCQTECQCADGVYGCSDVCQPDTQPEECQFGRQLIVESQCCSRWVCREEAAPCSNVTLDWTECSCASSISHQWTNKNPSCQWTVQQRVCSRKHCDEQKTKQRRKLLTDGEIIAEAKHFCEKSLYHRYEFITEDNCKSTRMHHQKTCASECHMPDGRRLCCLPNEFDSLNVLLKCGTQKTVLRTLAVIAGCNCVLC